MQLMWVTYRSQAKRDYKFAENMNDVRICLLGYVVEHWLKVIRGLCTLGNFDNQACIISPTSNLK